MKTNLRVIPLVSLILMSQHSVIQAEEQNNSWYFSPMLSYIKADNDRQAGDDFGLMLGVGKQISDNWNVEFSAAMDTLDFNGAGGGYKQRGLIVDGLYFFNRTTIMKTYGIVGAGLMSTDIGATDSTNPLLNVGLGIMQPINNNAMQFRADIRYRMDMDDESLASEDEFNDFVFNVGVTIPFGNEQKSTITQSSDTVTSVRDSDNDGIDDDVDRCPGSRANAKVDSNGCVIVHKTEPVEAQAKDSDNDGIVDTDDDCPSTESGASVDTKGCEIQQSFILKGVEFVTGSDELTTEAKSVLDEVAATLIKNSELNVEVAGYTDNRGNANFNQRLSQKRAEAVKVYLSNSGVDINSMVAKGYGEDDPVTDNSSAEGRARNRRVEMHIIQ